MVTVIDNEELPKAFPSLEDLRGGHRALTPEQKAELRELIRSTTLEAPDGWGEAVVQGNCLTRLGRSVRRAWGLSRGRG